MYQRNLSRKTFGCSISSTFSLWAKCDLQGSPGSGKFDNGSSGIKYADQHLVLERQFCQIHSSNMEIPSIDVFPQNKRGHQSYCKAGLVPSMLSNRFLPQCRKGFNVFLPFSITSPPCSTCIKIHLQIDKGWLELVMVSSNPYSFVLYTYAS